MPHTAETELGTAHVLLTGATGFVGQAVLERLLTDHPATRISLLVRGKGGQTGQDRLRRLLRKPVFGPWREAVGAEEAERVVGERITVLDGSMTSVPELPSDLDVVIHSASTVSFDPPIHEAFDTNVNGAVSLYQALLASGSDPHVVHVSTCYVGGLRRGVVAEGKLEHDADWRTEWRSATQAHERTELTSREPARLERFMSRARRDHGKEGPIAAARASEDARREWVRSHLVDAGRRRAQSLGWTDVYTLTKALAERAAEDLWGEAGHRLSVVRPAIIESALRHPFPGWIDGFKVADPLIFAYGRGQLPDFPGLPDSILDVIPVDFVVNAILAAAANPAPADEPAYFHIASGASNPLPFHRMYENVRDYYVQHPLPKDDGFVEVPTWKFAGERKFNRRLLLAKKKADLWDAGLRLLPNDERKRALAAQNAKLRAGIATLGNFTDLYRAYVQTEIIFDDRNARALNDALPAEVREDRGFDVERIDWEEYLQKVHLPSLSKLTAAHRRRKAAAAKPASACPKPELPRRTDVLAVFDLERTVLDSNIVEQYLWVRTSGFRKAAWPKEAADLLVALPGYLRAEKRDRGEFIRAFLRRYRGMPVARLEQVVGRGYADTMLRHTCADALTRIREHRAAGHRTVLVTGSIGLLAAPLAGLFDEVVGSSMHVRDGVLTGYLTKPPLVDEARAAWLRRYAEEGGYDLAASYGYGDSHSDLAWLSLLGKPSAINPDAELARASHKRNWDIHRWKRGGSGVRSEVVAARVTMPPRTEEESD
ncbi:SDR family oxidoreductase [Actinacidiphila glaucinigra]|uniref:HAD-superfamily subfamily IB hydrolase, TIGR01490 n=1 Tax=Actinacidiphila glaucinigra TaxID=235986 RepID=A0A239IL65_9ACTN|nr:SDR family oxidoreductase [Actinacidiphila glaucinigra]SNS94279.1 HAD-superfamily subfamily IB hydrolase, TIGR01490 [Actinacidiphila glaucinigra]